MKRLLTTVGLCALVLSAYAQTTLEQVRVPGDKAALTTKYRMEPNEFLRYEGEYYLSNGKTMALSQRQGKMYAQLTQQPAHEIVATGYGNFVGVDGQISMDIGINRLGFVHGEVTYIDPPAAVAGGPAVLQSVSFAAR
jgi:hypothetical protein